MRTNVKNFISRLSLISIAVLSILVLIYDYLNQHIGLSYNISLEAKINILLILVSTFVIHYIFDSLENKSFRDKNLGKITFLPHQYLSHILERVNLLKKSLINGEIRISGKYETAEHIIQVMDSTQKIYHGLNVYFPTSNHQMKDFYQANINALKRGVEIHRYFVIKALNKQVKDELTKQKNSGINVFYIFEEDLYKIPFFRHKEIKAFGLFDNKLLVYDISTAGKSETPFEINIEWGEKIEKNNPFPHLINSDLLRELDD